MLLGDRDSASRVAFFPVGQLVEAAIRLVRACTHFVRFVRNNAPSAQSIPHEKRSPLQTAGRIRAVSDDWNGKQPSGVSVVRISAVTSDSKVCGRGIFEVPYSHSMEILCTKICGQNNDTWL